MKSLKSRFERKKVKLQASRAYLPTLFATLLFVLIELLAVLVILALVPLTDIGPWLVGVMLLLVATGKFVNWLCDPLPESAPPQKVTSTTD